jgi:hypothetical protein
MDNLSLHFETNSFELTPMHMAVLDSIASFAKKYPELVFEISGHTDSIGSENNILSQNRAQSVLQYLRDVHRLPDFRFITLSLGFKHPITSNNTEVGRAQNRRVEIRQLELELYNVFYRRALQATNEGKFSEAFSYLNKWLLKIGQGNNLIMLLDPRFSPLKKNKRWAVLEQKIRDSYGNLKYPKYAFLLDSLRMDDLKATGELSLSLNDCMGNIPELDSVPFYLPPMSQIEIEQKLKEHFLALRPILEKVGFPKKSEFGRSAASSAFFLLQHSLDSASYVRWLPILQKTCEEGEASWMSYAMLFDRCQVIVGKPQRYGTHIQILSDGTIHVLPWEGDENTIDEYRAEIGLPLLSEKIVEAMQKKT